MATVVPVHSVRRAAAPVARLIRKVWSFGAVAERLAAAELDAIGDIRRASPFVSILISYSPPWRKWARLRVGRRGQRVDVQGDGRARRAAAPGVDVGDVEARVRRDERPVEVVGGADEERAGADRGDGTRHRDGRGRADDPGGRTHGSWLPPCGRTARVRRDEGVIGSRARVAHLVGRRDARRVHGRWAMGGPPPRTGGDPDVRRRVSRTRQVASDTQVAGGRMTPVDAAGSAGVGGFCGRRRGVCGRRRVLIRAGRPTVVGPTVVGPTVVPDAHRGSVRATAAALGARAVHRHAGSGRERA